MALIVADGDVPARAFVERLIGQGTDDVLVIAADGGALKAESLGLAPAVVVGDADSLAADQAERLRRSGTEVIVHPAAKDESDTELAVLEALRRGATRLVIVGAFGGRRFEHSLANVLLLASANLRGVDACLADGAGTLRVLTAGERLELDSQPGDFVSLLPLSERATGVTTAGLRYALDDAVLEQGPARGLSNEMTTSRASVSLATGRLAVVHSSRNEEADR